MIWEIGVSLADTQNTETWRERENKREEKRDRGSRYVVVVSEEQSSFLLSHKSSAIYVLLQKFILFVGAFAWLWLWLP